MDKTNFKCPRCHKKLRVAKCKASHTCPYCNYSMVITSEDLAKHFQPYRSWFKTDTPYRPVKVAKEEK